MVYVIGFYLQCYVQCGGGYVFEVIGVIGVGGVVLVGYVDLFEGFEVFVGVVFVVLEYQVFKQVCEVGVVGWFVFVVDVVLDVDCDDWCFVVGVYYYLQFVGQGEFFEWNVDFGYCSWFGQYWCWGKCVQCGGKGYGQQCSVWVELDGYFCFLVMKVKVDVSVSVC